MAYEFEKLNRLLRRDERGFIEESEAEYSAKLAAAADAIAENRHSSPIVLLSGPSGSGKTTSAHRLDDLLELRGIHAHTISMDDYFMSPHEVNAPKLPNGEPDLESPECLDWRLLAEHFGRLERGRDIDVPRFDFITQTRSEIVANLSLASDEVVIFEGIHALNTRITADYPHAFRLYISARSDFLYKGNIIWKRTLTRLLRRAIRDANFRGTSAAETLNQWENVRDGEKKYISPYRQSANLQIDTTIPYELMLMKSRALEAFENPPKEAARYGDAKQIIKAMQYIHPCGEQYVPQQSILREFIGGGLYN